MVFWLVTFVVSKLLWAIPSVCASAAVWDRVPAPETPKPFYSHRKSICWTQVFTTTSMVRISWFHQIQVMSVINHSTTEIIGNHKRTSQGCIKNTHCTVCLDLCWESYECMCILCTLRTRYKHKRVLPINKVGVYRATFKRPDRSSRCTII